MPELFELSSKSAAPAKIATPEAVPEVVPSTMGLLESESLEPALLDAQKQGLPQPLTTVETLFFYSRNGNGEAALYQVNVPEGTLAIASESIDLFPTALSGLLASEPTIAPWLAPAVNAPQDNVSTSEFLEPDPIAPEILESETLRAAPPRLENEGANPSTTATLTIPPAMADASVFTLVQGTAGKNFLIGSAADNAVFGFEGDDLILVGAGNNLAFGGTGDDTIIGGLGDDILFGGAGNDVIEGGAGNDHLFGGDGDDILYGGAGANVLVGGAGADIFRLGTPGAYGGALVGATELDVLPDTIADFSIAEGDRLDFSLIAAQPAFAGVELLPFLSFVQVGANTEVQVTTPLGQTTTEAILLDVEADTITPSSLSFTTPAGLPLLK